MSKRATILVLALVAVGVGIAVSPLRARPTITWTPRSLTETVIAGETVTVPVSFISSENLTDLKVRVVPELADVVSVTPTHLDVVRAGEEAVLTVIFAPSVTALPKSHNGTIQLREIEVPSHIYSKPLPVNLTVLWQTNENDEVGYTFLSPPKYSVFQRTENLQGSQVDTVHILDSGGSITIDIVTTGLLAPLESVSDLQGAEGNERLLSKEVQELPGRTVLRSSVLTPAGPLLLYDFLHEEVLVEVAVSFPEQLEARAQEIGQIVTESIQF